MATCKPNPFAKKEKSGGKKEMKDCSTKKPMKDKKKC